MTGVRINSLPHRLIQADAGGDRYIQALDHTMHGQTDQMVARFLGEPAHTPLLPHDQCQWTRQIGCVDPFPGVAGSADQPDPMRLFQPFQRARQIGDLKKGVLSAAPLATLQATGVSPTDLSLGAITACTPAASALRRQAPRLCGS